jgi:hypothetical protein
VLCHQSATAGLIISSSVPMLAKVNVAAGDQVLGLRGVPGSGAAVCFARSQEELDDSAVCKVHGPDSLHACHLSLAAK